MGTMTDGRWPGIALALLLASCSGEKRSETTAVAPVGPAPAATPVAPLAPTKPVGSDAVDAALTAAKDFNAKALTDLAGVESAEKRVRDQANRALEAARRGDGARVTAARTAAEAAHKSLVDGQAAFQTAAAEQQVALDMAATMCGLPVATPAPAPGAPAPGAPAPAKPATPAATPAPAPAIAGVDTAALAAYEGCLALPAEQALLAQNVAAVTGRYQAAEAAYRLERPKLEEAAATMALGR
ncbi:MAG: hypothetical protein EPO51_23395 [Phenylobacterium sp.]|uniref:hypothetical protein n=1 Tax=Phenylobacterium sp. TaxID=1871053 RepID=UPI00120E8804|nr:hypothetical protein [Phenylobacterium sp.]TAJ69339.1 MAG: hypothetical protein EPO51_23395 [Phenylobacterium sp.]